MLTQAHTQYGILEGVVSNAGFALFRGVPYAAPPVGELRWRPPQPPAKWEGIRKCDVYGPICPQKPRPMVDETGHDIVLVPNYPYPPDMDEDCLTLKIYTPAQSPEDKLPVMLYIHGGGVQEHFGSDYEYCGDGYCQNGCILVSINYRLNVFGYFVHPELAAESENNASGNYGLMDQIQALKWVKENIAAFGGDPENITIFGQSGGGRSVQAICCAPSTKGLFQRASIHSAGGIYTSFGPVSREEMERRGTDFMQSAGCANIAELRTLKWQVLLEKFLAYADKVGMFLGFNIYADGGVLPESLERSVALGYNHDVDYIVGCTVDEGVNPKKNRFNFNILASVQGWGTQQLKNAKKPIYIYCFDRPQPGDDVGTPHSCDVRYLFGSLDGTWRPYAEADYALSQTMITYWSNFAKTGNPNGEGLSDWVPFDKKKLVMRLGADKCEMHNYSVIDRIALDERQYIANALGE